MSIGFLRREGVSLMRNLIFGAILLPAVAVGQSINADFDVFFGSEAVGNGVPSDAFGAAANQPGRWNRVNPSGGPKQLVGLDGVLTNVWLTRTTGNAQRGGWNNPINTGDYALLLNDAAGIGTASVAWTLDGLQNGWYRVYTYAVSPIPQHTGPRPIEVYIQGAQGQNPQIVTGPMPGNSFQHLITHSIHDVYSGDGKIQIQVSRTLHEEQYVNGFQIVAVPEPISAVSLVAGFVVLALRRKRKAN
jgi:hypothetical protein